MDLTICDKEPIHILGRVQAHGFLVVVNLTTSLISHISENIEPFIEDNPRLYLGKPVEELESRLKISGPSLKLGQILDLARNNPNFETINPLYLELAGTPYNLIVTISGDDQLLEFEPDTSDLSMDVHRTIGRSVSEILSGKNLQTLLQNASSEIKKIIRYDRVMIYRFNEDGHGEVIAEVKNEGLEPFLGFHYPASDIPKQARELYKINLTRIIADVHSETSPILTYQAGGPPLDLTHSVLRAVSPIHIQYLKNMGVASSFSISLIARGELWGLIACHNYSSRFINYKARDASKLIGQILSPALELRQEEEETERSIKLNAAATELIDSIERENHIRDALTGKKTTIIDITTAPGVVLLFDNQITCIGVTPDAGQIREIVKWLVVNIQGALYYTNKFSEAYPPAKNFSEVASGILACLLSRELAEFIIWFKPEQIKEMTWAGNPEKVLEKREDGLLSISPRTSFASWTEMVKETSEKWSNREIAVVVRIREQIIHVINRKANEVRVLNERLKLAYEELDTFSFTISHDLRNPLSAIKNYSELMATTNTSLDPEAKMMLDRIRLCANKMNFLISEILNYSRLGRIDIAREPIDMAKTLQEIKTEILSGLKADIPEFIIGGTPAIQGEPTMIYQVFANLIHNAVKYSSKSTASRVKIEGVLTNNQVLYSISDNGVGIDMSHYDRVFELFKRMDNASEFEGTGVGLAIVKRIVERHDARIWFESNLGVGTTFYILFNN